MNVVASSPEGLEKSLAEEISNLGGFNINTYKKLKKFFLIQAFAAIFTQ